MNKINPIPYFSNPIDGRPLSGGKLYIGNPDTDPAIPVNQKQVYALQENGNTVSIPQPIILSVGGTPVYNGTGVSLYVSGDYSLKVLTSTGVQRFYIPDSSVDLSSEEGVYDTVAAMVGASPTVGAVYKTKGYYAIGDGGASSYLIVTGNSGDGYVDHNIGVNTAQLQHSGVISVLAAGARGAATAEYNLLAIKAVVSKLPEGGTLVIPPSTGTYTIDTGGGLSEAILIDKRLRVVIDGVVQSNYGVLQANPPFIFNVTGDDVVITGTGVIKGDGTINDLNLGDINSFPGLIMVSGDGFEFFGPTIDTPPKVGIALNGCSRSKIHHSNFMGGPSTYVIGNTAHFGLYYYLGGDHLFAHNNIFAAPDGGIFTQGLFTNGSDRVSVIGNKCIGTWEKLSYINGDYNIVSNNYYEAPVGGNYTDAYRLNGSYNKLIGNTAYGCKGPCQIFDGVANEVLGNLFVDCFQAGIIVTRSSGAYTGGFNFTKIIGNTVIGSAGTKTDGIRVMVDGASSQGIIVSDNLISSMTDLNTEGGIKVGAISPYSVEDAIISGNRITGVTNGIYLDRVVRSVIANNSIRSAINASMLETGGAYNKYRNNRCRDVVNVGISGISSTSEGSGNSYGDSKLVNTVTLSAAITTTVVHGGVAPNAKIFFQTANDAAGLMIVSKGWPTPGISGNDLTIKMANGTAAAGTEQITYSIVQ